MRGIYFNPLQQTLSEYQANLVQNEQGEKLFEVYFKKMKGTCGGLFNQKKRWNVFRMADIEKYEPVANIHAGYDKNAGESIYLSFHVGDACAITSSPHRMQTSKS